MTTTNDNESAAAPGWYPDQTGTVRYWDGAAWTEHTHQPEDEPQPTVAHRTGFRLGRFLGIGAIVALALIVVLAIVGAIVGPQPTKPAANTKPAPAASAPAPSSAPAPVTPKPSPSVTVKPTTPKPQATVKVPPPPKVVYDKITAREWALIAKNPDAHAGEAVVVYGVVTQFDSATGTDIMRADVDGVRHPVQFGFADYPTNTILDASEHPGRLASFVEGDIFKAKVTVMGSQTYDTSIGGSTTAPLLVVDGITHAGHVDQ